MSVARRTVSWAPRGVVSTADADQMSLQDSVEPSVSAGDYTIAVTQTITSDSKDNPINHRIDYPDQDFSVLAPRFVLDPTFVDSVYPPPASRGTYDRTLPHIILKRGILPWEVSLQGSDQKKGATLPWLAVAIFPQHQVSPVVPLSVATLLGDPDRYVPDLEGRVSADEKNIICQTATVTMADFLTAVPRRGDLPYLAHVRKVSREGSEQARYAVVIANRFPYAATTEKYVAHVVSLEGFEDLLGEDIEPEGELCFISLWSWDFTSEVDVKPGFPGLVRNLTDHAKTSGAQLLQLHEQPAWAGRMLETPVHEEVSNRLARGFVPVSYWLASGKKTFAWYRGPCSPVPTRTLAKDQQRILTSSQAMVYVQAYGVVEVGHAAAWTLGRALGLADPTFCGALLRWRHNRYHTTPATGENSRGSGGGGSRHGNSVMMSSPLGQAIHHLLARVDLGAALMNQPALVTPFPVLAEGPKNGVNTGEAGGVLDTDEPPPPAKDEDQEIIETYIENLRALRGVPFSYLVPDSRMLKPERIHFFYVDRAWIRSLVYGALSIGLARDYDVDELDPDLEVMASRDLPCTGFLMRSALVAGWPDLQITAEGRSSQTTPTVMTQYIAPDVMFCLISEIPKKVTIAEPLKAMHFGVDQPSQSDEKTPPGECMINLRSLKNHGEGVGDPIPDGEFPSGGTLARFFRDGSTVLKIQELADAIAGDPRMKDDLDGASSLTSAQLAIQLMNLPYKQTFGKEA